jgi:hypothetical protein
MPGGPKPTPPPPALLGGPGVTLSSSAAASGSPAARLAGVGKHTAANDSSSSSSSGTKGDKIQALKVHVVGLRGREVGEGTFWDSLDKERKQHAPEVLGEHAAGADAIMPYVVMCQAVSPHLCIPVHPGLESGASLLHVSGAPAQPQLCSFASRCTSS